MNLAKIDIAFLSNQKDTHFSKETCTIHLAGQIRRHGRYRRKETKLLRTEPYS